MTSQIDSLIDKSDTKEVIISLLQQILEDESAAQVELATTAGKADPTLWSLRVFTERANPFELFRKGSGVNVPTVNIFFDRSQVTQDNGVNRQTEVGTFALEVYGIANSSKSDGDAGDALAAQRMQRGVRLVRNILMDARYDILGADRSAALIGRRHIATIETFRPPSDSVAATHTIAARISLEVQYNEYNGEYPPETLEYINAVISRARDGSTISTLDYDFTS